MEVTIESRLTVLENQREIVERQLNSLDHNDPTKLIDILHLHTELEEILYSTIQILTENYNSKKEKLWQGH